MSPQQATGQILLLGGALLLAVGAWLYFGGGWGPLGRLPGDIRITNDRWSFHFPIVTSLLISALLTLLMNLWLNFRGR